ncbi:MAG: site-2 protease family protein, partial [Verrucomicrobiota bacterium]
MNLLLFYFFSCLVLLYIRVAFHEGGHAIAGKLCGYDVGYVVIGVGHRLARLQFWGIAWIFSYGNAGGLVLCKSIPKDYNKAKECIFSSAGMFGEILMIALLFAALWLVPAHSLASEVLSILIIIFSFFVLLSLIPMQVTYYGSKMPTDGMRIWKCMRGEEVNREVYLNLYYDTIRNQAPDVDIEQLWATHADVHSLTDLGYHCYLLNLNEIDVALPALKASIDGDELTPIEKAYLCDLIASLYLFHGKQECKELSLEMLERGLNFAPYSPALRQTLACKYMHEGKTDDALGILIPYTHTSQA